MRVVNSLNCVVYVNDIVGKMSKLVDESLTVNFVENSARVVIPTSKIHGLLYSRIRCIFTVITVAMVTTLNSQWKPMTPT